jgi:hypothetical protein
LVCGRAICVGAVRLKNGNTLISGNQNGYVRDVNPKGETVWEVNKSDFPDFPLYTVQEVSRLKNGNTLINNWTANLPREQCSGTVQLLEITRKKKVVWALSDWQDLGPASATQLLDEPGVPEEADCSGRAHQHRKREQKIKNEIILFGDILRARRGSSARG